VTRGSVLLYVVLPYAALTVFVVGHWWRYRSDQYGWGARSTQLLESRVLKYASTIFHLGVLAAIGGHLLGILIPQSWTAALGISDDAYHVIAVIGGVAAGGAVCVGFALLVYRRLRFARVRVTTTRADVITFGLLGLGIVTGMLATLTNFGDAVHYRESVGPYFRNLMILNPEPELMTGGHVTFIFQAHVTIVWVLVAFWPFSRLVHAWSVPVDYPRRSPVLYRPRAGRPRRAGRPPDVPRSPASQGSAG
jgi:nitrate reductase gamma subunit